MFRVILWSQWKWSRVVVLAGGAVALCVPVLSVHLTPADSGVGAERVLALLQQVRAWGSLYPILAGGLGLLVAMSAWAADHRGRHVHALTLPIPRWKYVLLRYGSAALVLAIPASMLLAGGLVAAATVELPSGLEAYPFSLALRFALALLTAFSLFFAVSGGTPRTAGLILGVLGALVLFAVVAGTTGWAPELGMRLLAFLLQGWGPLDIFTGRWMLVDV